MAIRHKIAISPLPTSVSEHILTKGLPREIIFNELEDLLQTRVLVPFLEERIFLFFPFLSGGKKVLEGTL